MFMFNASCILGIVLLEGPACLLAALHTFACEKTQGMRIFQFPITISAFPKEVRHEKKEERKEKISDTAADAEP